jgi:hypothetical protein
MMRGQDELGNGHSPIPGDRLNDLVGVRWRGDYQGLVEDLPPVGSTGTGRAPHHARTILNLRFDADALPRIRL